MVTVNAQSLEYKATINACKLCTPLGAALVFKGIENAVPLLHGSQGCATYIRRYLISHYKEPIDIACSNFAEETAIFGGQLNLKRALDNIRRQYNPELIGIATTCLSETIGDDVPRYIKDYRFDNQDKNLPHLVHVSTPSYNGTHQDGFAGAVRAVAMSLTSSRVKIGNHINLFPSMVSPADMRHLKEILSDFNLPYVMLPDYSETLDGPLWTEYLPIPPGGAKVADIRKLSKAIASIEFGKATATPKHSTALMLMEKFAVPGYHLPIPIGIRATDEFFDILEILSGEKIPDKYKQERGRLIDSYVDGHKFVMDKRAIVYGEDDLVSSLSLFLVEMGVIPVLIASGGTSGRLRTIISEIIPDCDERGIEVIDDADFDDIESMAKSLDPHFLIGSSKGYKLSRKLGVPLLRVGFPIHDRIGGARLLHLGYRGTQVLFDRLVNLLLEQHQASSVGYTYF